jgi:hypothetical protein
VLADREQFVLDADAQQEWERINNRPARSLPGLRACWNGPRPLAIQRRISPRHEPLPTA